MGIRRPTEREMNLALDIAREVAAGWREHVGANALMIGAQRVIEDLRLDKHGVEVVDFFDAWLKGGDRLAERGRRRDTIRAWRAP